MVFNLEFRFAPIGSLSDYSPIEEFNDIPHPADPGCEPHSTTIEQQHDPNSTWPSTHPYPLLNNPYYDLYNTKIPSTPVDLATQTIESMASAPPNIDFGNPVIFYDSHPEEQEGYLYSYYSSLKATLAVAWTGDVPKPLLPGHLRIVWWTRDGTKGQKDYELHEHRLVKDNFHALLHLPEIRRCLVTGFSGQNPYAMESGNANIWESTMDRKLREDQQSAKYWASKEAQGKTDERGVFDVDSVIESVVKKNEEAEKERLANIQKEDV